ncbi:MAG: DEAD/DEAH box helicase [Bacilli bacterium]
MLFENLDIIKPIQKALKEEGYENPTPIQAKSIPELLKGKDLLGCAQTGTGKTASFAIPILQNIAKEKGSSKGKRTIKAVILAPTRELAIQIGDSFNSYSRFMDIKTTVIFGGVSQNIQTRALHDGVDIVVATPGRMIDLYNQKFLNLKNVGYFVLDEADSMLDMGMIHDVKRIIGFLPKVRQNIFFSATMPKEISKLVDSICKNPVRVEVAPVSSTTETVTQGIHFVGKRQKNELLVHILKDESIKSVLVFSRTKHGANKIVKELDRVGIESSAIHGNKSQNARQIALNDFKKGKLRVLVATDIAARGIDVDELSHVINYDLPECAETYVHRIGRTGRAGRSGIALSFCSPEEIDRHKAIEKLINKKIEVKENPELKVVAEPINSENKKPSRNYNSSRNGKPSRNNQRSNNRNNNQRNDKQRSNNSRNKQKNNNPR